MGQALRRAMGRVQSSKHGPSAELNKKIERQPPVAPAKMEIPISGQDHVGISDPEAVSKTKDDTAALEERDPGYDAMLSKMVGRITSKPGGKLEMGEAFIVEKYNRPMPKLRTSKGEDGAYEQKPVPPGTLNAAQLQEIILLHHGKSSEHQGPMGVHDIANKFSISVAHVERIVQFVSLPPENSNEKPQ